MEDIIEGIQTDAGKEYGKAAGVHFTIGVTTTDTLSLTLNNSTLMIDVIYEMNATYSSNAEYDDRCVYRTEQRDGDTEGTMRDSRNEMPIKFLLEFGETLQSSAMTKSLPQFITDAQETVPVYSDHTQQNAVDIAEEDEEED